MSAEMLFALKDKPEVSTKALGIQAIKKVNSMKKILPSMAIMSSMLACDATQVFGDSMKVLLGSVGTGLFVSRISNLATGGIQDGFARKTINTVAGFVIGLPVFAVGIANPSAPIFAAGLTAAIWGMGEFTYHGHETFNKPPPPPEV